MAGGASYSTISNSSYWSASSGQAVDFHVPLTVGDRVKSIVAYVEKTNGSGSMTLAFYVTNMVSGVSALSGSVSTSAAAAFYQPSVALSYTVVAGTIAKAVVSGSGGGTGKIFGVKVAYDRV